MPGQPPCTHSGTAAFIAPADLHQIHLWLGTVRSRSNAHFDANNNLLAVIKGTKRVLLAPHAAASSPGAHPAFSADFHHSSGVLDDTDTGHGLPPGTTVAELGVRASVPCPAHHAPLHPFHNDF